MRIIYFSIGSLILACEAQKTTDTGNIDDSGNIIDTQLDPNDYDPGCFVVDGSNGFAQINDAMLFVEEGSTITFDNCEPTHEEAIVIDKPVTIVGSGAASFTLIPPTNEHGFTIETQDVNISGISIQSTRSGIYTNNAANVVLDDIVVMQAGNWGVKSESTTNLTVTNSVFSENGFGGVSLIESDASISDTLMIGNATTGVKAEGSVVSLSNIEATNAIPANETAPEDGYGIWAIDGSTVTSVDGIYDYNFLMGVRAEASDINLTGGSASFANVAGVFIDPGLSSLSVTNMTLEDNFSYGIVAQNTTSSTFNGLTISADPAANASTTAQDEDANGQPDWRENGLTGTAIYSNSDAISISNTSMTGYNNCGLYAVTDSSDANIDIQGMDINNVGRLGAIIVGYDGVANDVSIDTITDLDEIEINAPGTMCTSVGTYSGLFLNSSNVALSNLSINNVEAYGLTIYNSSADIVTMDAGSNFCSSVMAFEASATIDQGTFSEPNAVSNALGSSVTGYMASLLTIDNSTFDEQTDGFADFHVYLYDTDIAQISNSTFNGGYYGIYSRKTAGTYESNSFIDQKTSGYSVYLSYGDSTDDSSDLTSIFEGNTFTKTTSSGSGIRCIYGGQIELKDDSFTDYNGTYALYLDSCSSELEDVSFTNLGGSIAFAYDGNHEWDSVEADGVGQSGSSSYLAYFYPFSGPMNLSIVDSSFLNIGTSSSSMTGLYASTYNPSSNPINLNISDTTYSGGGDALSLNGVTATLAALELNNQTNEGIYANNSTLVMDNVEISNSQLNGIDCNGSTITMSNSSIRNAGSNGIDGYSYNGTTNCNLNLSQSLISDNAGDGISGNYTDLVASDLTVEGNGGFGISIAYPSQPVVIESSSMISNTDSGLLLDTADATVSDSVLSQNGAYGMVCSFDVTASCSNNELINNSLGEQSGCDSSCGIEPTPQQETDCSDGNDDDLDGLFDCDDNDCMADPACMPTQELICNDGIDDDMDGLFDCDDNDCMGDPACVPSTEMICDDGSDNDMDGQFDCDDSDCATDPACVPSVELNCNDGIDNDLDGQFDCDDNDCATDPACIPLTETNCSDGADDDLDGLIDCDDNDCANDAACLPLTETTCNDGIDNDMDGLLDCDDNDCANDQACLTPSLGFQADIAPIMGSCTGCHGGSGGFSFGYANMVGIPSNDIPTMNLIEAGNPSASYLWHKINGTHLSVGGSGGIMPPNGSLSQSNLDLIEDWILDGALP